MSAGRESRAKNGDGEAKSRQMEAVKDIGRVWCGDGDHFVGAVPLGGARFKV